VDTAAKSFVAPPGKGRIYVFQDEVPFIIWQSFDISVDGRWLASIGAHTYFYFDVESGSYDLTCEGQSLVIDVEIGHVYYVWRNVMYPRGLRLVDERRGRIGVNSGRLIVAASQSIAPSGGTIPAREAARKRTPLPKEERELVAVLNVTRDGNISEQQSNALTDRLREQLIKTEFFVVVERDQLDDILKEQAFQQSGCTSTECAVQVGKILGARKIISSRLIRVDENVWQFSVNLIDVETSETSRSETIVHEGTFLALLTSGTEKLVAKIVK
jgi:hypothetical protein